jgi:hypothetical protein
MNTLDDLDPKLQEKLNTLQSTKSRNPDFAARGKARYLAEALQLAVTSTEQKRLTLWIENIKTLFRRKEKAPMFTTLISVFLILTALLGGGGVTVVAAQSSQPGDLLYPVKTISEDIYYQLTTGDQDRLNLSLDYADLRMVEIQNMLEEGHLPSDAILLRLQTHLQTALELSVKNASEADRLLEQTRLQIEKQLQTHLQQPSSNPAGETLRLQVRDMLQVRIGWIEDGLKQMAQLRVQTQNQPQAQSGNQSGQDVGTQTPGGNGQNSGQMAGSQNGSGGWTFQWELTPTPYDYQYQYQNQNGQGGSGSGMGNK